MATFNRSPNTTRYGGADFLRLWGPDVDGSGMPTERGFDWTQLGNPGLLQRPSVMNDWASGNPDPNAISDWLQQHNYSYAVDNTPGQSMRWIEDAGGNYVTQPKNYATNDNAFMAAALAAAGLTGANILGASGAMGGGSGVDALVGGGADAFGSGGAGAAATNPALIDSALGTAGYGASSAGAGGGAGMGILDTLGRLVPSNPTDWLRLGSGLLGAATSRSGETTQSRAPWEDAQPFLRALLGDADTLRQRYMSQPVAPARQAATGNLASLANIGTAMAPGLLGNMNALGAGYDRSAPNRTQVRGLSPISVDWSSLLNIPRG